MTNGNLPQTGWKLAYANQDVLCKVLGSKLTIKLWLMSLDQFWNDFYFLNPWLRSSKV